MAKRPTKSRRILDRTFHEVMHFPPQAVQKTARKKGKKAAQKQKVAIALDKARRQGARIRRP